MFERPAPSDHPIHDLLARRWSTRAYTDQSISLEDLHSLLEAARWSPSSGNGQPWNFIIARKENADQFEKIASTLTGGNAWAKQAAVLMIAVASLDRSPGKPNATAPFEVGLACQSMAIQATALGLSMHMMGGFSADKARELFAIPERFQPQVAISIGYPADPNTLPDDLRAKDLTPRTRKPLADILVTGQWGETAELK